MSESIEFRQMIQRGCGLDVHRSEVVATIQGIGIQEETRSFATFTEDLENLCSWLLHHQIETVVMESTGVYWKPVFHVLERHFKVMLVNARFIKNVPGKKTDKKDSEWLAKLLLSGLLENSFVPERQIRDLRDLSRYYKKVSGLIVQEKNRIHKQLQDANIKLSSVISDVFGVSGMRILTCIADGVVDTNSLLSQTNNRLRASPEDLRKALTGHITAHHVFMIRLHLDNIENYRSIQKELTVQMDAIIQSHYQDQLRLQTIPGISEHLARNIVAEIGFDMSVFPSQHHLASWAGVCPGNNQSAGKNYSSRARPGNKALKTTLVEAAWAAVATKGSEFRKKYHKMIAKMGKKKALFAIAHKILLTVYVVLDRKVN